MVSFDFKTFQNVSSSSAEIAVFHIVFEDSLFFPGFQVGGGQIEEAFGGEAFPEDNPFGN